MTRTRKQAKTDETHVHPSATLRAAAKVGEREFARWLAEGVLDRVPFRGRATRYTERNLLQATAARVMIDNGRTVRECAAITGAVSNDELARIVGEPAPSKPAPASSAQTSDPAAHPSAAIRAVVTRYELELLPGLSLSLRADASAFVRRVASEIAAKYRTDAALKE
jgi:hypothetical protein